MRKFDRIMFGLTLIALALAMMTISLDAFNLAGVQFIPWTNKILGLVSGIFTFIFVILGIIILCKR